MPVDCPQRDERQPWLGDRTMGCWGESFLFDNSTLYSKWTRDICEAQREDGCIPDVAPASGCTTATMLHGRQLCLLPATCCIHSLEIVSP